MNNDHQEYPEAAPTVTLWIDADACPRAALQAALQQTRALPLVALRTVSTWRHEIDLAGHITVDAAPQATDLAILARMKAADIVVTQDYGLAALVLARGGRSLSPSGLLFTEHNIDTLLSSRADMARIRRSRHTRSKDSAPRLKGPSARTAEDDQRFQEALAKLLLPYADW